MVSKQRIGKGVEGIAFVEFGIVAGIFPEGLNKTTLISKWSMP
jgi:hypothetical protein